MRTSAALMTAMIIIGIVGGIYLNWEAMTKFKELKTFEVACNSHYREQFRMACQAQPGYMGFDVINWTLNLSTP